MLMTTAPAALPTPHSVTSTGPPPSAAPFSGAWISPPNAAARFALIAVVGPSRGRHVRRDRR